jgi:hypothetical protein
MSISALDSIVLDPKARCSVTYAKARVAIDTEAKCRAERRKMRAIVIEHLHGTVAKGEVVFPDNSKARF